MKSIEDSQAEHKRAVTEEHPVPKAAAPDSSESTLQGRLKIAGKKEEAGKLRWDRDAIVELNQAKEDFSHSLGTESDRIARDRQSSVVTDGDVSMARRHMTIQRRQSRIMVFARVAGALAIFFGGNLFCQGWDQGATAIIVGGILLAILSVSTEHLLKNKFGD